MNLLAEHFISKHSFIYVLPGKFCSDPLEGRFGWYRQVNKGNFFMSINQLFQAEKKIRCLSLIEKNVIFRASNLDMYDDLMAIIEDDSQCLNVSWLSEVLNDANLDDLSESDACVTYYVNGYIAQSVSRRRKCTSCKQLLVKSDEDLAINDVSNESPNELIDMANRGGLSTPTEYCFAVCTFAMKLYSHISANETVKKNFLSMAKQRDVFIAAACEVAKKCDTYNVLQTKTCLQGHNNFNLILQTSFNCFAKNELKRLNRVAK